MRFHPRKKYIKEQLVFQGINSKIIYASFDGGTITSDAGLMWLREVDRRIGLLIRNRFSRFPEDDPFAGMKSRFQGLNDG